jgi:multicomponent Na+:H+ antiporter subunit C
MSDWILEAFLVQYPYIMAFLMLAVCVYAVVLKSNLIKKALGLTIMIDVVNLFLILTGYRRAAGPIPPIYPNPQQVQAVVERAVDPLPQALVLTAIVIDMCVTAFAIALVVLIYRAYGTLDVRKIRELRG